MSDLISREQACDALEDAEDAFGYLTRDWREVLMELPPIQPKRGRWIPVTNGRGGHECDQCHNYAPSYQTGEEHLSDFCPSCGADMRGEQYG